MPKYSMFLGLARKFSQWKYCEENTAPGGVVDIAYMENYSECKYHNLVTRIMRAQRRSVAIQLGHKLTSIKLVQSINAWSHLLNLHIVQETWDTYKHKCSTEHEDKYPRTSSVLPRSSVQPESHRMLHRLKKLGKSVVIQWCVMHISDERIHYMVWAYFLIQHSL